LVRLPALYENAGVSDPQKEAVQARFGATAAAVAEHAAGQVERVREELRDFLPLTGEERALDSGTGAGVFALALAPLVREVVGVDLVPELLAAARAAAPANATFVEGDATHLPFEDASFDLAASRRTLHHVARPELAVAELTRVVRPGGRIFVDDQIAPADPLAALELDRFERARDPAHARTLPDVDLRHLFEANDLVLERREHRTHRRELGFYLELAGCRGEEAERVRALSPGGPESYVAETAWYLLRKPSRTLSSP
jgi:ubiquinone/menaquinone biosynthesis C-methylase UbiE